MSVQVFGCNHVAIEVGDIEKAVAFYRDLFGLEKLDEGEGDAFFKLGEHQFLAMFEHRDMTPMRAIGTSVSWYATHIRSLKSGIS
jgi:catechol 2,3-dioxygenase-like lactoylglutathione lyase family enzyme